MPEFLPAEPTPDAITTVRWGDKSEERDCGRASIMFFINNPDDVIVMMRNITQTFSSQQTFTEAESVNVMGYGYQDNACADDYCWDQIVEFNPDNDGMVFYVITFGNTAEEAYNSLWNWHNQFVEQHKINMSGPQKSNG
jgi:hypothetical protein